MRIHTQRALRLLLASVALLVPSSARSDGMGFKGHDWGALRPILPNDQVAAILHRNGRQKMVIALNFNAEDQDNALWIFPVPGAPSQTKVDVADSFPAFRGEDPRTVPAALVSVFMLDARLTQLWPLIFDAIPSMAIPSFGGRPGVSIHGEVEKWGIHTELIAANSVDDLTDYLLQKRAGVPAESLKALQPYLTGQYVLVVTWISSQEQLLKEFPEYEKYHSLGYGRQPCLFVEFPTDRPFYPLRPTSTYGDEYITVRLLVVGYVEPHGPAMRGNPDRLSYGVSYWEEQEQLPEKGPATFRESLPPKPFWYTSIKISAPAREFTDDLWFSAKEPPRLRYARAILWLRPGVFLLLPVIAGLSYVAAGLAAVCLRRPWKGYAVLGLWNLLTILGLWLAIRRLPVDRRDELRKIKFLRAFSYAFVFLTVAMQFLLLLPFGLAELHHGAAEEGGFYFGFALIPGLLGAYALLKVRRTGSPP